MEKKAITGIMLTLLLIGMLMLTFNIQLVKAESEVITVDNDRVECSDADFTSIQEAINVANSGDTICVYSGIYDENLVVNKSVSLIGQGPRITIIIGDGTDNVIYVKANNTAIRGFTIYESTLTYPVSDIYVYNSSGSDISYNIIMNNRIGICLYNSNNNIIHHNNFFRNIVQAYLNNSFSNIWDEGYPSGGNYWDDHAGVDLYNGPYQNETGSDGISDVSYIIDADNEDRYPLMDLVNLFIDGWLEVPGWINITSNSTISDLYFNPDAGAFIKFNVTGEGGTIGYCRAAIPKEVLWVEDSQWIVMIDDMPVTYMLIEDIANTYIYFTYEHSTRMVTIIGTHVIGPPTSVVTATVDIDPNTLNLKSKGKWINCRIELTEGYDVSDIGVSTVMLNDTIPVSLLDVPAPEPVPTEIGDYDSDGIPDLMVKFNRTMVSEFILSRGFAYGNVTLTITGEADGTPFEGSDSIRVVFPSAGCRGRKR